MIDVLEQQGIIDRLKAKLGVSPKNVAIRLQIAQLELEKINRFKVLVRSDTWPDIRKDIVAEIARHDKQIRGLTPNQQVDRLTLVGHWAISEALMKVLEIIEGPLKSEEHIHKDIIRLKEMAEQGEPDGRMFQMINKNAGN